EAEVVVVSTAVKADNPEVVAARERLIPVVRRAEMLAELMRLKWAIAIAGTHGKTTTTGLVAAMLEAAAMDPTIINGGILNAYGTNARLGSGDWMVVEADESDGTFIKLPATIAVVTNMDPEHLDYWGSFDAARRGYQTFVSNIPFYGFAALCIDHPEVQALIASTQDRKILAYGFSPQADVRGINMRLDASGGHFDVQLSGRAGTERRIEGLHLPLVGQHNVQNALAAVAVAVEMGMDDATIAKALAGIKGVKRRFTKTGEGAGLTVIDDYGHHPVEISAVLKAARSATKAGVVAVVQPHRYTRLKSLFEEFCTCFNDADAVIVADVYAAGEVPIDGASKEALVEGLRNHGHRRVVALEAPDRLAATVRALAKPGDMVVCLGAGNITQWAYALPGELDAIGRKA
ncbi:MAG: UDP-N-acetylmuramate--L-alanine ligase, partial [Rhodospirillales bacterium]|nr:UDP-N-acetylmuramate--L-alanine ligase [Rhodospirillales bacterium]